MRTATPHAEPADSKAERIATACLYRIATGAWDPAARLPSLREAAAAWDVDPITVQRAYRQLEARGVVQCRPKSGFYVADSTQVRDLTRHRATLEQLFAQFAAEVRTSTGLSVLGAFRSLGHLAERHAAREPECLFVECTDVQAAQIAARVTDALRLPVPAERLSRVIDDPGVVPSSVRWLLTTGFHEAELAPLAKQRGWSVIRLTVQFDASVTERMAMLAKSGQVWCRDEAQGVQVAEELSSQAAWSVEARSVEPDQVEESLHELFGSPEDPRTDFAVVLSPTSWEAAGDPWRACERVVPYTYDVASASVAHLAARLGLPDRWPVAVPASTSRETTP